MHKCAKQTLSMLTDSQKQNLSNLDSDTLLEIMHECAEALGLVSVDEYCKILGMKKRTIYKHLNENKIKCFEISNHKFPIINI